MDREIAGLGYVGLWSTDLSAWDDVAVDVLGMEKVSGGDGRHLFRMDHYVYRLSVERADTRGLAYIGWEVATPEGLECVVRRAESAGVRVECCGTEDARARGVLALARCTDPSGLALELFYGGQVDVARPFNSKRAVRFVTGDQGMGHLTMFSTAFSETVEFYEKILGFELRDILSNPMSARFLGCNKRHHSIAVIDGTSTGEHRVHHVMVEVERLDQVGKAYDLCMDGAAPISMTLGRHWNDEMVSFYLETPSDVSIEYGYGGRTVDSRTWVVVQGAGDMSYWGHRPRSG